MRKVFAVVVLALFAIGVSAGLPGLGSQIGAEPPVATPKDAPMEAPKKAPVPNPEFPKNYQLWMRVSLFAECKSENGKAFTYAIYGSVPTKAMVSLSRKEEKWGSFVYWQEAQAKYFLKKGDEIRTVPQKDELMKEVARIAGPVAVSWMTANDLPKECMSKVPGRKGTLALFSGR